MLANHFAIPVLRSVRRLTKNHHAVRIRVSREGSDEALTDRGIKGRRVQVELDDDTRATLTEAEHDYTNSEAARRCTTETPAAATRERLDRSSLLPAVLLERSHPAVARPDERALSRLVRSSHSETGPAARRLRRKSARASAIGLPEGAERGPAAPDRGSCITYAGLGGWKSLRSAAPAVSPMPQTSTTRRRVARGQVAGCPLPVASDAALWMTRPSGPRASLH